MSLLLVLLACNSEVDRARNASLKKAESMAAAVPAPLPEPQKAQTADPPALYVDASRSMSGFVGCNRQATAFDVVLDRLITDLGVDSLYRFGEEAHGSTDVVEPVPLGRAAHCPAFYDRQQNPDYQLFRLINEDSTERTRIYLTDGVQSDMRGENQSPSVQELKRWLRGGHGLAVLAFRGSFDGPAWSEQRQEMIGRATSDQRPFYAFLFASSDAKLGSLLRTMSPELLGRATLLRLSSDSVRCAATPAARLPKYATSAAAPWWVMIDRSTFERIRDTPTVLADYRCTVPTSFPLDAVLPRIEGVGYSAWEHGAFVDQPAPPAGLALSADSVAPRPGGSVAFIKAAVPFDRGHRAGYYGMRIVPEPGELRRTVTSLSTDSDAQLDSFDRTYRFSWLIEQLAEVQLDRGLSPAPFALTIQYR